jgi:hypothetical protein
MRDSASARRRVRASSASSEFSAIGELQCGHVIAACRTSSAQRGQTRCVADRPADASRRARSSPRVIAAAVMRPTSGVRNSERKNTPTAERPLLCASPAATAERRTQTTTISIQRLRDQSSPSPSCSPKDHGEALHSWRRACHPLGGAGLPRAFETRPDEVGHPLGFGRDCRWNEAPARLCCCRACSFHCEHRPRHGPAAPRSETPSGLAPSSKAGYCERAEGVGESTRVHRSTPARQRWGAPHQFAT